MAPVVEDEAARLRRVYGSYDDDRATRARWTESNPGNAAIVRERHEAFVDALARRGLWPLDGRRLVELGCGSGGVLQQLADAGADRRALIGIELLESRAVAARARLEASPICVANGASLPLGDGVAHVVVLATVLSSLRDERTISAIAAEIARVLHRDGCVLVYDLRFGNPRNRNVRPVKRGDLERLFPDATVEGRSVTVLPPLARRLGRRTSSAYRMLRHLPILRTHHVLVVSRVAPSGSGRS